MECGRIRWLAAKGYGFIVDADDATEPDTFFHAGDVGGVKFDDLRPGQLVEFERVASPRGPRAIAVRVIDEENT